MEGKSFERREGEPKHNIIIVDFLRHGASFYMEDKTPEEKKKEMMGKYPRDLTPEGEKGVEETVEKIVETVDPENDTVVLWSSPAWRSQGSEDILIEKLKERGIPIHKDSAIPSMRNFDKYDNEFMEKFWEELAPTGKSAELAYARNPEFQEKNDKFESQPGVKRRAERTLHYIGYLAKHANLEGKRLRIIGVSHFEFLNPIIEDIFGSKVEKGEGINKAENVQIVFDYNPENNEIKISADFRDEHKENIVFDRQRRHFIAEQ